MHSPYINSAAKAQIEPSSLAPNIASVSAFFYALFSPEFVHHYPDSWIEIVVTEPAHKAWKARFLPAHDLRSAIELVLSLNELGFNCYVGAALRHGDKPKTGRGRKEHFCAASHFWVDCDHAGDYDRVVAICKQYQLKPSIMVVTGTVPHRRIHLYFKSAHPITNPAQIEEGNTALRDLFGSDNVQNADRLLRVAGSISYPSFDKAAKGYITELTTLHMNSEAPAYSVEELRALYPGAHSERCPFLAYAEEHRGRRGKSDDELLALLEATRAPNNWHNNMRAATASMVGKGWPEKAIRFACAPYAKDGIYDKDVEKLYDSAVAKFGKAEAQP